MDEFYTLKVAGVERKLPICAVDEKLSIAAFVMFGDVEITVATATELIKKCPDFDYVITAEAKGIPLAYEMARQAGKNYIVARKGKKLYMKNPVQIDVRSITTDHKQVLYLDQNEIELMKGKKILVVDDVISTGESLNALLNLVNQSEGEVVGCAAVLAEGDAADRDDIIFLEPLPLFFKD